MSHFFFMKHFKDMPQPFTLQNTQQQDFTEETFQRIQHLKKTIKQYVAELLTLLYEHKQYRHYLFTATTLQTRVLDNKNQHSRKRSRTKHITYYKHKLHTKGFHTAHYTQHISVVTHYASSQNI